MSLLKLGKEVLGARLTGSKIIVCQIYTEAKIHCQISRCFLEDFKKPIGLGEEVHIDWTDLEKSYNGFVWAMFIIDMFAGMVFIYFMCIYGIDWENLTIFKNHTA